MFDDDLANGKSNETATQPVPPPNRMPSVQPPAAAASAPPVQPPATPPTRMPSAQPPVAPPTRMPTMQPAAAFANAPSVQSPAAAVLNGASHEGTNDKKTLAASLNGEKRDEAIDEEVPEDAESDDGASPLLRGWTHDADKLWRTLNAIHEAFREGKATEIDTFVAILTERLGWQGLRRKQIGGIFTALAARPHQASVSRQSGHRLRPDRRGRETPRRADPDQSAGCSTGCTTGGAEFAGPSSHRCRTRSRTRPRTPASSPT